MKTVKDYLDLGLVFVTGDIVDDDGENDGTKMKPLPYWMVEHCNAGQYEYGNAKVESFAWRNNDGVKPEYKGLIEILTKIDVYNGDTEPSIKHATDVDWRPHCCSHQVAKWRPVVLQLDKPKFTIKEDAPSRTMTVNIEGRDYLIVLNKLTGLPKEGKPIKSPESEQNCRETKAIFKTESTMFGDRLRSVMDDFESVDLDMAISDDKPVYTAEMHAKGESPQVGSEVKVCIEDAGFELDDYDPKFEGKTVTVKAAFVNEDGDKIVAIENDKGNCACYVIECIKPIIKTIKVNGFDVPAPMSEAPEGGSVYFSPDILKDNLSCRFTWSGGNPDFSWLSKGIIHSTKVAAIAHAKAMLGIDPNA